MENLIKYCLELLCDPTNEERHFVTFQENDSVVLVVNNYGGLSNLELGALTDETITQLGKRVQIVGDFSDDGQPLMRKYCSFYLENKARPDFVW